MPKVTLSVKKTTEVNVLTHYVNRITGTKLKDLCMAYKGRTVTWDCGAALAPVKLAVTTMLGYVTSNTLAVVCGVFRGGSLFLPATHIIQGEKKWPASNAL